MLRELSKMEQRYDAVMGVIKDGLAVTEVAEKFGVTRQSLHADDVPPLVEVRRWPQLVQAA